MTSFVTLCACRGQLPKHISRVGIFDRDHIVSMLLRNRKVVRFIVAPDGFGKSTVAAQYASTIFEFRNTFWVSGKSTSFMRDLDTGHFGEMLLEYDGDARLIIFDGLPVFDEERAELFASMCDTLLDHGVEVIASCTPVADVFGRLLRDRVVIHPRDLLLTTDELISINCPIPGDSYNYDWPEYERVMCLRLKDASEKTISDHVCQTGMPAEMALLMFTMLALESGTVEDLKAGIDSAVVDEHILNLCREYPFLEIDNDLVEFQTCEVGVDRLCKSFRPRMPVAVDWSNFETENEFCYHVASQLVGKGNADRACRLIHAMCACEASANWLAEQGEQLLAQGCLVPAMALYQKVSKTAMPSMVEIELRQCERLYAAGLFEDASAMCHRILKKTGTTQLQNVRAIILQSRIGTCPVAYIDQIRSFVSHCRSLLEKDAILDDEPPYELEYLCEASVALALTKSTADALSIFNSCKTFCPSEKGVLRAAIDCITAVSNDSSARYIIEKLRYAANNSTDVLGIGNVMNSTKLLQDFDCVIELLHGYVIRCFDNEVFEGDLHLASCAAAIVTQPNIKAITSLNVYFEDWILANVGEFMGTLALQGSRCISGLEPKAYPRKRSVADAGMSLRSSGLTRVSQLHQPDVLRVNMFGGFRLEMNGSAYKKSLGNKRMAKSLVSIIALHAGTEVSGSKLQSMLWGESSDDAASKSRHSLWKTTINTLGDDGYLPYIVFDGSAYWADMRYMQTDAQELDGIHRYIVIDGRRDYNWSKLYDMLKKDFSEELLPSVNGVGYINDMRKIYREKLTEVVAVAASCLIDEGNYQKAVSFTRDIQARGILDTEICCLQMKAQALMGNWQAETKTYLSFINSLASEVGADPPRKIVNLHNSLISCGV